MADLVLTDDGPLAHGERVLEVLDVVWLAAKQADACRPAGWEGPATPLPLKTEAEICGWLWRELLDLQLACMRVGKFDARAGLRALRNAHRALDAAKLNSQKLPAWPITTKDPVAVKCLIADMLICLGGRPAFVNAGGEFSPVLNA